MKKHAIIPIFIPHEGCKNDCVFCNQKVITAKDQAPSLEQMDNIVRTWLSTIETQNIETCELAFYGGSFTGLEVDLQLLYLKSAKEWKEKGHIQKIHISTRPDYINKEILNRLKTYGVDIIELGVQSFHEEVLAKSKRGHDTKVVYGACDLIKEFGFTLGIQLMIGLPGDCHEKCMYSVKETIKIKPEIARLYPTIILPETELFHMFQRGDYQGLSQEEALYTTKEMFRMLTEAGINVIRVGLKSSDFINIQGCNVGNTYHPAFRQLVESQLARESVEEQINAFFQKLQKEESVEQKIHEIILRSNPRCFSNLIGHKGSNKQYFNEKYQNMFFIFEQDETLNDYCYQILVSS